MTLHTKYCSQSFGTYIKSINPHNKPPLYKSGNWSTSGGGGGDLPKAYIISRTKIYKDKLILHPYSYALGFPGGSVSKESACNMGNLGSIPGLGRSPRGGHSNPLQYSCLEIPQGQRSLVGCSPYGRRDELNWETKHSTVLLSITHTICPTERINRILNPWFGQST